MTTKTAIGRSRVGAVDKRSRKRGLTRAIKTAIDVMWMEGCTRAEACQKAGITERAFYLAMHKAEVLAHWNSLAVVVRSGERAENFRALVKIRDGDNAAAGVRAIQQLEATEDAQQARSRSVTPGIVIMIGRGPAPQIASAAPAIIDAQPLPEPEPIESSEPVTIEAAEPPPEPVALPEEPVPSPDDPRRLAPRQVLGINDLPQHRPQLQRRPRGRR